MQWKHRQTDGVDHRQTAEGLHSMLTSWPSRPSIIGHLQPRFGNGIYDHPIDQTGGPAQHERLSPLPSLLETSVRLGNLNTAMEEEIDCDHDFD